MAKISPPIRENCQVFERRSVTRRSTGVVHLALSPEEARELLTLSLHSIQGESAAGISAMRKLAKSLDAVEFAVAA